MLEGMSVDTIVQLESLEPDVLLIDNLLRTFITAGNNLYWLDVHKVPSADIELPAIVLDASHRVTYDPYKI